MHDVEDHRQPDIPRGPRRRPGARAPGRYRPHPPRHRRRLAAPGRVRRDGRPGLQLRPDRRRRRQRRRTQDRRDHRPRRPRRRRLLDGRGEYTSVASQSELARAEVEIERRELVRSPEAEQRELAELYIARGLDEDLAVEVARQLSRDPELALEIHAREELGVDPHDLPSPWLAAGSSFGFFAIGALLPLLPYLLGATTLAPALVLTALGLFGAGAAVSRVTARPWWFSGTRQLVLGAAAGGLTYLLGLLIGQGL